MKQALKQKARDSAATLALFRSELHSVATIAREVRLRVGRVAQTAVTLDDLHGFGREGLLAAARSFDPARGVPFAHWAGRRIRGAMFDGLRQWGLTRRGYRRLSVLSPAGALAPDDPALALACMAGLGAALIVTCGHSPPEPVPSPEELVSRAQAARRLRLAIGRLPDVERELVERCDLEEQTLGEAAAAVGVCKPWASRLRARALARLVEAMQAWA